jgi:hypothetical protein
MICNYLGKTHKTIAGKLILETPYKPACSQQLSVHDLSEVAQTILQVHLPSRRSKYLDPTQPEVIALRLLDFFSSRQGFIRRKGQTFRTEAFYQSILPQLLRSIRQGLPLKLSTLCLCTPLGNTKFGGEWPYPHMASYIALENIHKIAQGAAQIYPPGVRFFLGFEGYLFQPLYFQTDTVLDHSFAIFKELNEEAYKHTGGQGTNPVEIVNAMCMIERAFGSYETFDVAVSELKQHVPDESVAEWQAWYRKTVSASYFPSVKAKNRFIDEQAKWRSAVYTLKNSGGRFGGGFVSFAEDVIPFTPSGRRADTLALQLVPENSFLPHQRIITHESNTNRWRMKAYEDIRKDEIVYAPRYVEAYSYPFYFEKIQT